LYKTLIVDDEFWALQGMNNIIPWEEYGFQICKLCTSVEEAIIAIEEFQPDIIFTDIRMPVHSGMDLLTKINDSKLPILTVIVSAHRDFDVAKQAIVKGVFAYLVKPLEKDEVIALVKRAREKLDERNIADEGNVAKLDLSDERNLQLPIIKQLFLDTAAAPNCYLMICTGSTETAARQLMQAGIAKEIYVSGYKKAYIYCGSLQELSPEPVKGSIGISMKHDDFSEFSVMLREAIMALEGNFIFSENKTVASIQMYLAENYKDKINMKELAERFYLSEPYLYELFRKYTNTTVVNFIKQIRLNRAIYLLTYTDAPVKDISEQVGYEDAGYFGRLFRKEMSCSPEAFRRKSRN
jgi:two-component system response regulator YesN